MMVAVARDMAQKIANHFADVIFPIKVLIRRENQVTVNRGEGGGVAVGDTFNAFALGQELIDPDTKESLGREEVKVGTVKITQVNPKTSLADIVDDQGIDKGAILRKPAQPANYFPVENTRWIQALRSIAAVGGGGRAAGDRLQNLPGTK